MKLTIRYFISFLALGLVTSSLGPTLPALAAQTGASMGQISRLFIARSLGSMIGSLLIGPVYDRRAGHPMLAISLLAAAGLLVFIPLTLWPWILFALFVLLGVSSASINVGGNAMTAFVHSIHAGPYINALHFSFSLGGALAPLLVGELENFDHSLLLTYLSLALLVAPTALLLVRVKSPAPFPHKIETAGGALPVFSVSLFVLFLFLEVGGEASLMGWIYSYSAARGMSTQMAAYVNSAFWAAFTVGRLIGAVLALRFRPRFIIIPSLGLWILTSIVMFASPPSEGLIWLGSIGMGLTMAPIFPMAFALAQRRFRLTGRVTGLFLVGSGAGGMFWPWLIGQFFDSHGPQTLIAVVLVSLFLASIILAVIISRVMLRTAEGERVIEKDF